MTIGIVHIVEWLNPDDDETGRQLHEELQPICAGFSPKVEIDFHQIETAGQLLGLLLGFTEQYPARQAHTDSSSRDPRRA